MMIRLAHNLRRFGIAESGVAAIEFVFVLPFLLLLFFGMIDLTQLIGFNRKITQSASVVADLVTQNRNNFPATAMPDYYAAVSMIMSPTSINDVRVEVFGFRPNGGGVTQRWSVTNGSGPNCGPMPTAASLVPLTAANNDLVVARVCVNYEPSIATFLGEHLLGETSFLVEETITQRPRGTLQLDCFRTTSSTTLCP